MGKSQGLSLVVDRMKREYDLLSDSEAARLAQEGDLNATEELLERYRELVRIKSRSYFLIGADRDDIFQEGMIGLYKAIRDYREDRDASFKAFADLCVTRQIITAIKTATRQKHAPLNSYVSLNSSFGEADDNDRTVMDLLASSNTIDPAEMVISDEEALSIKDNFQSMLSGFEADVLRMYVDGHSYQEIAAVLDRHVKSIDNALQRIKRKIEQHIRHREQLARSSLSNGVRRVHSMAGQPA